MRYVNKYVAVLVLATGVVACESSSCRSKTTTDSLPSDTGGVESQSTTLPADKCPSMKRSGERETTHPNGEQFSAGFLEWFEYFTVSGPTLGGEPPLCPPGGCTVMGKLKKAHGGECPFSGERPGRLELVEDDPCFQGVDKVPVYKAIVHDWPAHSGDLGIEVDPCKDQVYEPSDAETLSCDAEKLGRLKGKLIAIPGYWDENTGAYHEKAEGQSKPVFTLSCMTGAAAKCVHWGYPPWGKKKHPVTNADVPLAPYHRACVEAVRAHFCGDRAGGFTCEGTKVDIFDRLGVQKKAVKGAPIESVWGADGLHCLNRDNARWPLCKLQFGACTARGPCPATIDDAYWNANANALLAITVSGVNHPAACDGEDCCVSNPRHCPKRPKDPP